VNTDFNLSQKLCSAPPRRPPWRARGVEPPETLEYRTPCRSSKTWNRRGFKPVLN